MFPTTMSCDPGKAGVVSDELIDFTDLAPTIISLTGGEIPEHLEGRPILGKNREKPVEYLFLSSDRSDNGIDMVRTVTDGRFVYSRNFLPFSIPSTNPVLLDDLLRPTFAPCDKIRNTAKRKCTWP